MIVGIFQSILLLLVIVAFYSIHVYLVRRYDSLRAEGSSLSESYTIMAVAGAVLVIVQPTVLPQLSLHLTAPWGLLIQLVGLLLIFASLALYAWSRINLRQFFGERLELQPEQHLVNTGPYAYVRHPIYTSFFLFVFGMLFINPSLPTLLVVGYTFYDFLPTTKREESFLQEQLPGYEDYMSQTSRYFPNFKQIMSGINSR
jgi:protein-S-isoprenylcysteine O-methyltransferase Ste14